MRALVRPNVSFNQHCSLCMACKRSVPMAPSQAWRIPLAIGASYVLPVMTQCSQHGSPRLFLEGVVNVAALTTQSSYLLMAIVRPAPYSKRVRACRSPIVFDRSILPHAGGASHSPSTLPVTSLAEELFSTWLVKAWAPGPRHDLPILTPNYSIRECVGYTMAIWRFDRTFCCFTGELCHLRRAGWADCF